MEWAVLVVAVAMLGDALRLRRRLLRLRPLPPVRLFHTADGYAPSGVELPEHVRRAAASHARENGFGAVGLVPSGPSVVQALDLARRPAPHALMARGDAPPAAVLAARFPSGRAIGPGTAWTLGAEYALVLAALILVPWWGAALAVLYCALPCLVFAGTAISPRDLRAGTLLRLVHLPLTGLSRRLRTARARNPRSGPGPAADGNS
ncbi:hypothetical protein [Actinomadura macrotermitis]|uniref:Uncharacterized protein n=1 Tax=Actinomadura macrotermitis TaxID=2585200 RepID=A0A7K0C3R9_9ACTN|nr:hypothetical protein [Actinomadura macrotermitis]MQY08073.1 hypothetical protein [Actinomadura macrotermitis]